MSEKNLKLLIVFLVRLWVVFIYVGLDLLNRYMGILVHEIFKSKKILLKYFIIQPVRFQEFQPLDMRRRPMAFSLVTRVVP